jgi:hypothetical protein
MDTGNGSVEAGECVVAPTGCRTALMGRDDQAQRCVTEARLFDAAVPAPWQRAEPGFGRAY